MKLEGLFQKKAKENETLKSFEKQVEIETKGCQNSDNHVAMDSPVIEENKAVDEEIPITQPKTQFERAEEALKLEEMFRKKALENKEPDKKPTEIKPIDTKKELAKIAGVSHDTIERVKKR